MLKKSANTPSARLLNLFDILNDWSDAPGITIRPEQLKPQNDANALKAYLAMEAEQADAAHPDMLANQLYFMALSALQEKLVDAKQDSLLHAKNAATALIKVQTVAAPVAHKPIHAFAASFLGALFVWAVTFFTLQHNNTIPSQIVAEQSSAMFKPAFKTRYASAASTATLVAEINRMRDGNCRLLEAIQLPDQYQSIYFQNIVHGQISTDYAEQEIVRELLAKIRCSYSPMLMKKST